MYRLMYEVTQCFTHSTLFNKIVTFRDFTMKGVITQIQHNIREDFVRYFSRYFSFKRTLLTICKVEIK